MGGLSHYGDAVQAIKQAILKSQYEAAKGVNAQQLALYYSIGGYISANTRTGTWGKGAIDAISSRLQEELPGLRGFSATNLRNMRIFFEAWSPEDAQGDSLVATDESVRVALGNFHQAQLMKLQPKDAEAFKNIGFTHHMLTQIGRAS